MTVTLATRFVWLVHVCVCVHLWVLGWVVREKEVISSYLLMHVFCLLV